MLPRHIVLHKARGLTPLETIAAWRAEAAIPADVPTSFAGRLDPMAEGKLLVLIGEECKRQREYTKLDKEYVVEVALGVSTDTGDVLGIPSVSTPLPTPTSAHVRRSLLKERGIHEHAYPVFSSKTVSGKPLFLYALEGTLHTIEIPKHKENLYSLKLEDVRTYSVDEFRTRIEAGLSHTPTSDEPSKALGADFRIGTIRPAWENLLAQRSEPFTVLSIRVACGSGTYMRTLAERIGASLGTSACALSIRRTRIGRYIKLPLNTGFWLQDYK